MGNEKGHLNAFLENDKKRVFLEAEKEIEKARQLNSKSLDLSGMRLVKVPENIKHLTQLESLNLSYNELENDSLEQLVSLSIPSPIRR
ncbi:MAG: hypothetical protein HYZ24_09285 [Chloroflexi bacterium]|jgi:Leucine-rich repeat (LRR) protein|nr:hypothetical protein [Chloroflexota bacterium]